MCGIVGYVGPREATPLLISGLKKLEYRGYDSAGLAVAGAESLQVVRCRGKLAGLETMVERDPPRGTVGVGHTRWATHGRPSEANAHPHRVGSVAVVHNGIIENYLALRARLEAAGRRFLSETDTEIVAHLIDEALQEGAPSLVGALRMALRQVHGAYALAVVSDQHPGQIVAAKMASPLVIGLGKGETFLASDVPAFLEHTREVVFLDEGDIAEITAAGAKITDVEGNPIARPSKTITWDAAQAEKGGYPHFMLKEIHEQPRAIADTLRARLRLETSDADLEGFDIDAKKLRRVVLLACGTSYHAGLVGKFLIEGASRIPCEVDLASEFRYRDPVVGPDDLVIAISQSGETADTLAAVKEARQRGSQVLAICNVVDSAIPRASQGALYTHAGPEIGVASTKCFTAQLSALALVSIYLGRRTGTLAAEAANWMVQELSSVPTKMSEALESLGDMADLAAAVQGRQGLPVPGPRHQLPDRARGRAEVEGDLLHPRRGLRRRRDEARADRARRRRRARASCWRRAGRATRRCCRTWPRCARATATSSRWPPRATSRSARLCDRVLTVPDAPPILQPFLTVLPLQLMSYAIALAKGNDVDQPRNLAKSVTVE